jgi:hypothetical protein
MKHKSPPFLYALPVLFAIAVMMMVVSPTKAIDSRPPVVVELFTSQGCSSCPPADALLNELTEHEDVIALSLPIDYWDNLGWPDTFASPVHSDRQRDYAMKLGNRQVYTPQMVINGKHNIVGSRREQVLETIQQEQLSPKPYVPIKLATQEKSLTITIDDKPADLSLTGATVWIIPYHPGHQEVAIGKGENAGRTIAYSNVVDGLMKLGAYEGKQIRFEHSLQPLLNKGINGCLIFIQDDHTGEIIGVQTIDPSILG